MRLLLVPGQYFVVFRKSWRVLNDVMQSESQLVLAWYQSGRSLVLVWYE